MKHLWIKDPDFRVKKIAKGLKVYERCICEHCRCERTLIKVKSEEKKYVYMMTVELSEQEPECIKPMF